MVRLSQHPTTVQWYDGEGMASKDIVYVSYNHRTELFGWLSLPELSEEIESIADVNSSGNWGSSRTR